LGKAYTYLRMSATTENKALADEEELVDYDEDAPATEPAEGRQKKEISVKKGSYVGIHSSGFRDLLLRPELINAVTDCGFEHPSEVQQECIPQAVLGMDIICQAKSGMGKTAVFVLAVLQQLTPVENTVDTLVLCHSRVGVSNLPRVLAFQQISAGGQGEGVLWGH